jgi:hypothetical protein
MAGSRAEALSIRVKDVESTQNGLEMATRMSWHLVRQADVRVSQSAQENLALRHPLLVAPLCPILTCVTLAPHGYLLGMVETTSPI